MELDDLLEFQFEAFEANDLRGAVRVIHGANKAMEILLKC